MKFSYLVLVLYLYCSFFSFAKGELIKTLVKTNKESNPIDYKIFYQSEDATIQSGEDTLTLKVWKNFTTIHDSYLINPSLYICNDESGEAKGHYVMIENRCYSINMPNENDIETIKGIINMTSEVQYSSYIQGKYFEYGVRGVNASVDVIRNEIILYGKKGKKMFFYYIKEGSGYDLTINEADDKNEEISCKLVKENINICAIPQNGQIRLKFILHIYFDRTVKGMMEKYSKDIDQFNNHENAILYDTENSQYKIICARRKDNGNIECLAVYLNINYNF